jgi:alpha-1,6-mannosyltransferase
MRIVRLANFVTPRSGGLRTALLQLGEGYQACGHEAILVVPGKTAADELTPAGRVITVPGWRAPGLSGYRVMMSRRRLRRLLADLAPDRIEVSDQSSLRWLGRWARRHGVRSVMVSHESLYRLLGNGPGRVLRRVADYANLRTARDYDTVVCTTSWASRDFRRIGAENLAQVALGVDLETFHPAMWDQAIRDRYAAQGQIILIHCGRLSKEKQPERSVEALASLRAAGVDAVLLMAGGGPLRSRLERQAAGLPVHFIDFVVDRAALAGLLATADVAIAPGPVETFGLAALEALACGTPVVVSAESALPEVVGPAGVAVQGEGAAFAEGVAELLRRPEARRRTEARTQAERYSWPRAVAGFLSTHGIDAHGFGREPVRAGAEHRFVTLGEIALGETESRGPKRPPRQRLVSTSARWNRTGRSS